MRNLTLARPAGGTVWPSSAPPGSACSRWRR